MNRRSFLGEAALALVGGAASPPTFALPGAGRYLSHSAEMPESWDDLRDDGLIFENGPLSIFMDPPRPQTYRYVRFPWTCTLTVVFERLLLTFTALNPSRDLVARMNAMSPDELFAGYAARRREHSIDQDWGEWDTAEGYPLVLPDPVNLGWEVATDPRNTSGSPRLWCPDRIRRAIPDKQAKFLLTSVMLRA